MSESRPAEVVSLPESPDEAWSEVQRLRSLNRDLISVLAQPAIGTGQLPAGVLKTLADVLLSMLRVDLVYVRAALPGQPAIEAACASGRPEVAQRAAELGAALERWTTAETWNTPTTIADPLEPGELRLLTTGFGLHDGGGVVAIGARRRSFPTASEELLSRTAINQAVIGLQGSQMLQEHDRVDRLALHCRLLFDTMLQGVVYQDREGTILSMNPAAERILGKSPAELVGETSVTVEHHTIREDGTPFAGLEHPSMAALRTGREQRDVVMGVFNPREGGYRWITVSAVPLFRPGEAEPYQVYTLFDDITGRKQAADALRLRLHVTNTPLAMIEWDAEYRVTSLSERAEALFGWSESEVVGKRTDEIPWVREEDRPSARAAMRDLSDGSRSASVHACRNVRKDGSLIHCEWYDSALHDAGGTLVSVLSLVLDVTERKRAEEALRESDRRKSEFLAVLSHELRNPLAPIRSSIDLLERATPGGEQAARARGVIRRQTEHLARLVDDLLDVTRISRGKIELERERIDLRDVLRRTCDDHGALFEGRRIELRVEASGPVWIDADATRIAQVVGNLLQNAAKFSHEGGIVTASIGARDGRAEIRVRDDGMGVPPELLPRLFEPFVQAAEGLARTKGGLGLGLALVKGLVELHGGSVGATSGGVERGAEFVVRLPLAEPPRAAAPGPEPGAMPTPADVLIIEDNVDAAQTIAEVLELEGHHVTVATDGRSGLERARELRPALILCDIGLPDVDGYEIARRLRADAAFRSTRLVAVSGYAQPEDQRRAEEAGFDAHVAKPASLDELLRSMRGKSAGHGR